MLKNGIDMETRLKRLNQIAIEQQKILEKNNQKALKDLKMLDN